MKTALVIPSHQQHHLQECLRRWQPYKFWDLLVVVEDGPERTFELPAGTHHYSHAEIDAELGADAWIISRRDTAIRSWGLLAAHRLGADLTITLDHDCYPHPGHEDLLKRHLANLDGLPAWESSVPGLRVRGLPYGDPGRVSPVLSVGLWSNVPDLDAPCQLAAGVPPEFVPPPGVRLVPRGVYLPVCGMHLAYRREFAPLAYFGLQGEGWPYRRFDDIWMGVLAKRVCDHLGWSVCVGEPFIRHDRASDPYVNLVKEAPGIGHHEVLWRALAGVRLSAATAAGCVAQAGQQLQQLADEYDRRLGRALEVWAGLFEQESH